MPIYDREANRLVVRIVYDGLGNAGKTTNLRSLCDLFTMRRRSEFYTPEERDGRTLCFDWLQLDTGLVAGIPLRCQVVSVPGQLVLGQRRARLLATADVVVLVVESTKEGVERVRKGFARTRDFVAQQASRRVPFVIQANKQDLEGALDPSNIASALSLEENVPVVAACATQGHGVRETIVLAIRAAADRVQALVLERGLSALEGPVVSPEELYAELKAVDVGDLSRFADWVDEGELSDPANVAATALNLPLPRAAESTTETQDEQEPDAEHEPQTQPAPRPATLHAREEGTDQTKGLLARLRALLATPSTAPADKASPQPTAEPPAEKAASLPAPPQLPTKPAAAPSAPKATPQSEHPRTSTGFVLARPSSPIPLTAVPEGWPAVPTSIDQSPSGLVWPSATGRTNLASMLGEPWTARPELTGQLGTADGSGKSGTFVYQAGKTCFKTSVNRLYADVDTARTALIALVREKVTLGKLVPAGSVLFVAEEGEAFRLWTAAPWLDTLRARTARAVQAQAQAELESALADFAAASAQAALVMARQGIVLDLHPSNFAKDGDVLAYLDDEIIRGGPVFPLVHAFLQRVEEHSDWPAAALSYVEALERELVRALSPADVLALDLLQTLLDVPVRSALTRTARLRLHETLRAHAENAPALPKPPLEAPVPFRAAPSAAPEPRTNPGLFQVVEWKDSFARGATTREYELPPAERPERAAAPSPWLGSSRPSLEPSAPTVVPTSSDAPKTQWVVVPSPSLPSSLDALPSGYIWPAATGRERARRVTSGMELQTQRNGEKLRCVAGDFVFESHERFRFPDVEQGRAALLQQARLRVSLGALISPETVLILSPEQSDGGAWLWVMAVAGQRLPEALLKASAENKTDEVAQLLGAYAKALRDAIALAAQGKVISLAAHDFSVTQLELHYVGSDIHSEGRRLDMAEAVRSVFACIRDSAHASRVYLELLCEVVAQAELATEGLTEALRGLDAPSLHDASVARARDRLLRLLEQKPRTNAGMNVVSAE